MKLVPRLWPDTLEGRMVAILAISLVLLLGVIIALDFTDRDSPIEWAESNATLNRLARMRTVLETIAVNRRAGVLQQISVCHEGYTLTRQPYVVVETTARTQALSAAIARRLNLDPAGVSVGYAELTRDDFSYESCAESEIDLPMTAIVVSTELGPEQWLNSEVHPHEWHLDDLIARMLRYGAAFVLVGAVTIVFVRRLSRPLRRLTQASARFADGLKVSPVRESGPPDLRRAIEAFNAMQRQVAEHVRKRTDTLAAISHDLRTPLTALRIKAEMVEDDETRAGLVETIGRMEKIIASALDFLRGEARSEPLRDIDLGALLQSECSEFEDAGQQAEYVGDQSMVYACRPEALTRAVWNLIENANKYGGGATVDLRTGPDGLDVVVSDGGPGIPGEEVDAVLEPFHRLSKARESHQGGFGLGLSIVQTIAQGHGGELILAANTPSGLVATIRLPLPATVA